MKEMRRKVKNSNLRMWNFFLQLHITEKCNLKCIHCYEGKSPRKDTNLLTSKEIFDLLDEYNDFLRVLKAKGTVYFTGGEPILDSNLSSYISKASKLGMHTMVLSNGTLINNSKAKELYKVGTNFVQISIDGLEKTHDYIRGLGSFQKATEGLENCFKVGLNTTVMTTLSKLNADEIEGIILHCIEHNVSRIAFGRLVPVGNGVELLSQIFTKSETLKLFKTIKDLKRKYENHIDFAFHDPLWTSYLNIKSTSGCSVGKRGLCIVENGDIMPCRRMDLVIGNIRNDALLDIWNSNYLRQFLNRNKYGGKCRKCERLTRCGGCRAIAKAINGNEFGEDPQCFLRTKEIRMNN
ncbi:MAG: radical SAM protein [Promethearchaeota archaeon]